MTQNPFDALGGGGLDMNALLQQAQAMQDNLKKAQEELAHIEVEGQSGAGLAKVVMTCKNDVKRVTIDPSLLGQLLGRVELRELLDIEVLDSIERRLQHLEPDRAARDAEAVVDLLRLLGPLTAEEVAARSTDPDAAPAWLASLAEAWRVVTV